MRKRNKIITAGAIAVAAGAVVAGSTVTANAMASGPKGSTNTATIGIVTQDPKGDGLISCTYTDVELPALPDVPGGLKIESSVGPVGDASRAGSSGGLVISADTSGVPTAAVPAEGSAPDGPSTNVVVASGTATQAGGDGAPLPGGVPAIAGSISVGTDGVPTVTGARQGTDEECAALRPQIPVPAAG